MALITSYRSKNVLEQLNEIIYQVTAFLCFEVTKNTVNLST